MGRPAKYTDPDDMWSVCEEYFAECDEKGAIYTMPGLALRLGFLDRQSLQDYKGKPEFSFVIKKALLKMQDQLVSRMVKPGQQVAGLIFLSKNWFGYRDSKDLAVSHSYDKDSSKVDFGSRIKGLKAKDEEKQEVIH